MASAAPAKPSAPAGAGRPAIPHPWCGATRCSWRQRKPVSASATRWTPTLGALMVIHLLGSATFAGAASGILGGCRLISSYPTGQITDAYGRKAGLFLGLSLSIVGSLTIGLATMRESAAGSFWGWSCSASAWAPCSNCGSRPRTCTRRAAAPRASATCSPAR